MGLRRDVARVSRPSTDPAFPAPLRNPARARNHCVAEHARVRVGLRWALSESEQGGRDRNIRVAVISPSESWLSTGTGPRPGRRK